jgi:putative membrane protein
MSRLARGALLLATAVVIAKLFATGQMRYYLSSSFDWLTALTAVILAIVGGLELSGAYRSRAHTVAGHGEIDGVLALGVAAVPLLVSMFISPRALGTDALGGTQASQLVLAYAEGPPPTVSAAAPRQPIGDVPDLLSYLRQAGEGGVGQHVHVRGLVTRSGDLPDNQFVLVRYAIVHCVADAQPMGFLIAFTDGADLSANRWVEVDGTLASEPRGSDRLVAIRATQILNSDEPPDPYVSPF